MASRRGAGRGSPGGGGRGRGRGPAPKPKSGRRGGKPGRGAPSRQSGPAGKRPPGPRRTPRPARALQVTAAPDAAQAGEEDGSVRLNRYLALAGVCSRRAADEHIAGGRVSVNGEVVRELGTRIDPIHDEVRHDEQRIKPERPVYVLFNKPKGVVCTNAPNEHRRRVVDYLEGLRGRVFTVGRLDADSEGLILVTNDGRFAQRMTHPRYGVGKTYAVTVKGTLEAEDLERAQGGVWLSDGRTSGFRIAIERRGRDRTFLKVTLREGRNREIRRVFAKLGYGVLALKRTRIGDLTLHGLGKGRWRFLHPTEVEALLQRSEEESPY
jgi:23S rRNA pseudouridine2605 synthase